MQDSEYKDIKDPVHGYISIEEQYVDNIIDTKYFQRLRNIRQLDTTRYVYPSAGHSRFEHTLGVYHLGSLAFESIKGEFECGTDVAKEMETTLKCSCLLHDIGHFPFSHLGEEWADEEKVNEKLRSDYDLVDKLGEANVEQALEDANNHEKMGCIIVLDKFFTWLEDDMDVNPYEVCAFMLGTSVNKSQTWEWDVASDLLSSHVDVDRLDYMIRDDFMSGASMVSVDSERMVKSYTIADNTLALSDKAHSTIGNFLDGRNAVYMWITHHHKVVYTSRLLEEMIEIYVKKRDDDSGGFTPEEILDGQMDDVDLIYEIRSMANNGVSEKLEKLHDRFISRNYLASCWKHIIDFNDKISDPTQQALREKISYYRSEVEKHLRNELNLNEDELMCEIAEIPGYNSQELQEIFIKEGDEGTEISKHDIYEERGGLFRPIPYIFVESGKEEDVLEELDNPDWLTQI